MKPRPPAPLYGLMAEFEDTDLLIRAAYKAREDGYHRMDAYTPMPVDGLAEAIGFTKNRLPALIFFGGATGAILGFAMQWYSAVIDYPLLVAGKPLNSWPHFIPITFELTILMAAFFAVFGMLGLNGLPKPYHPVFNVPRFEMASRSHFFLVLHSDDPKFDRSATKVYLEGLEGVTGVYEAEM